MHYCCVYGFMGLWADNIALMNNYLVWLHECAIWSLRLQLGLIPIHFSIISINTLQIVPALLQIVPGLKGSKTEASG
jgi:hypothetical protein